MKHPFEPGRMKYEFRQIRFARASFGSVRCRVHCVAGCASINQLGHSPGREAADRTSSVQACRATVLLGTRQCPGRDPARRPPPGDGAAAADSDPGRRSPAMDLHRANADCVCARDAPRQGYGSHFQWRADIGPRDRPSGAPRATPTPSISARRRAESGRRRTAARTGSRSSTSRTRWPSARSPSIRRTRTRYMSGPGMTRSMAASPSTATASTNRSTAAPPGGAPRTCWRRAPCRSTRGRSHSSRAATTS
jgi:hypothetical protein